MSSNSPEPNNPRAGGWLARLKGMMPTFRAGDEPAPAPEETQPTWGVEQTSPLTPAAAPPPQAIPVATPTANGPEVPTAAPAEAPPAAEPEAEEQATDEVPAVLPAEPVVPDAVAAEMAEPPAAPTIHCPVCQTVHVGPDPHCADCGYYFSPNDLAGATAPSAAAVPAARIQGRYELLEKISEREGVSRYRALDHGEGGTPLPVIVVEQQAPAEDAPPPAAEPVAEVAPDDDEDALDEILPSFDMPTAPMASPITEVLPARPAWPSVGWELNLLRTADHPALPGVVASFTENGRNYLVEVVPEGRSLWDAWDDPEADAQRRFGYLAEVAEALQALHQHGAMLEGMRPDIVVVTPDGRACLADLGDLLPLPLPPGTPVRGLLYTAPELMGGNGQADARADLYSFGAMLYALHVGRELTEMDFERPGSPKPFIPRFPDVHPAFGRLMMKTFRREVDQRFPTDEAGKEDPSGFTELARVLRATGRVLDQVRLEVASWTTTGIVRTGNEDAFALLHAAESRQEDMTDHVLVLLCDGMGGYEAGEIAAALTIQALRANLVQQKPFAPVAGGSSFATDALNSGSRPEGHLAPPADVGPVKQLIKAALKDANKQVFTASRAPGSKRRGMGCTAEVVYVDNRNVIVGHVGDSRAYHLREGQLVQLTRDQTLVNRLVELGTLTAEEAETHPRRNELQQAVGGQPDVEPGLYHGVLRPGDWVVVCSDGVTNHVTNNDLKQMLLGEGYSAETVARRLVNLTNINGATDNATVVVIRATPLS